jgi:protein-export membrane protein SecD
MKRCPTCTRVYDGDHLRFCLDDGSPLVDKPSENPAPATLVLPSAEEHQPTMTAAQPPPRITDHIPPTVAAPSQPRRNLIVWVVVIALGLPLLGGAGLAAWRMSHQKPLVWHLVLQVDPKAAAHTDAVQQTVAIIDKRLDAAGVRNYEVKPQDIGTSDRILINLPAMDDPERLKQLITTQGKLELVHVISPPSPSAVQTFATKTEAVAFLNSGGSVPGNRRVLPFTERDDPTGNNQNAQKWVGVESPPIISGSDLRNAEAVAGLLDRYQINFSLKADGAAKFGQWTAANINEYLGVVLNDEVKSIAYIKSQIYDQGEMVGRFTKQSAEDLAMVLKAGALPVPVTLVEEKVDR